MKKRKTRVLQASADDYWHKKIYVKQNIGWYRNTLFTLIWGDLCCTNISVNFWCTGGSPPEALRVYIIYICQQYTLTSAAKRPFKTNSRNTSFLFYFTTLACLAVFPIVLIHSRNGCSLFLSGEVWKKDSFWS